MITLTGLKQSLDSLEEGILFLDRDRNVVAINEAAGRMLGQPDEEIIHRLCPSLFRGTGCARRCEQKGCCTLMSSERQDKMVQDLAVQRPNGELVTLRMWAMLLPPSDITFAHCAVVLRDRTREVRLEEEASERLHLVGLVGHGPAMQELFRQILRAAAVRAEAVFHAAPHRRSGSDRGQPASRRDRARPTAGTGNLIATIAAHHDGPIVVIELSKRRANVLRHSEWPPNAKVEEGNYLTRQGKADVIVTNPPWGNYSSGKYGQRIGLEFEPGDVAERFIAKNMRDLNDGGRLVAVMPVNMLGKSGARFRKWLEFNHTVRAMNRDARRLVLATRHTHRLCAPRGGQGQAWRCPSPHHQDTRARRTVALATTMKIPKMCLIRIASDHCVLV